MHSNVRYLTRFQVDFCANNPCPEGHRCNDRGDDYTCECPGGRNGPDCNQVPRTVSSTTWHVLHSIFLRRSLCSSRIT